MTAGDTLTYEWLFIDVPMGSALADADLSDINGVTTSFTPDVLGTYVLQLVVFDGEAYSDPATTTVEFVNAPPVADAGADQVVPWDEFASYFRHVQLNGDGSYDPDGTQLTFAWTVLSVPAGSAFDDTWFGTDITQAAPSIDVDVTSDTVPYVFQLTVTDAEGESNSDTVEIILEGSPLNKK